MPNSNGGRSRARETGKKDGQRRKRNKRTEEQQTEGKRNAKTDRGGKNNRNLKLFGMYRYAKLNNCQYKNRLTILIHQNIWWLWQKQTVIGKLLEDSEKTKQVLLYIVVSHLSQFKHTYNQLTHTTKPKHQYSPTAQDTSQLGFNGQKILPRVDLQMTIIDRSFPRIPNMSI